MLLNEYKVTCSSLKHLYLSIFLIIQYFKLSYCLCQDIPSSMYYFMKHKRFTHLIIEDCAKCYIIYNDWQKTSKIGFRWRAFSKAQSFKPGMEIVFEFPDANVNYALVWPCL
ncbi:hypothetical protein GmHk_04G010970 [Glycine max]|nr:hypothetical protein GmHk_04G010970 [Glycine max]